MLPLMRKHRTDRRMDASCRRESAGQRLRSAMHRTPNSPALELRRCSASWKQRRLRGAPSAVRARGCPHRDDERLPARDRPEQQGDRLGLEREPEQLDRRGELGLHLGDRRRPNSAEISAAAIPRKWRAIRYSLTTSATSVNATLIGTSAIDGWRPAPNTTPWPTMNPTATATIPTCQLVIATTPYHSAVARTAPMAPPMTPPAMSPIVAGSAGRVPSPRRRGSRSRAWPWRTEPQRPCSRGGLVARPALPSCPSPTPAWPPHRSAPAGWRRGSRRSCNTWPRALD